jgi:hypothetical protein
MLHSDPADVTSAVVVMTVMRRTFITANRFRESEQKRQRSSAAASSACRIPSWLLTSQVRLFKALLAAGLFRIFPHQPHSPIAQFPASPAWQSPMDNQII